MNRVATTIISVTPTRGQSDGEKRYTTAGTLVNTHAIQPLQPPIRRGRALKWASTALDLGQLALFPKDAVQDLNVYGPRNHGLQPLIAPGTKPTPPTYQPLQQNLERAVKPSMDYKRASATPLYPQTSMSGSSMTAHNMSTLGFAAAPSTPGLVPHAPFGRATATPHSASERPDADDAGSKSLDQLPVKALFNLMSYPNPNQEQARKRWEAAKGGNCASAPALRPHVPPATHTSTPPFPAMAPAPAIGPAGVYAQNDINIGHANAKTFGFQRPNRSAANKYMNHPATTFHRTNLRPVAPHWPTTPTTSVGAPAPLTAGPPGQRRYQPVIHKLANYSTKSDSELADLVPLFTIPPFSQTAVDELGLLAPPARRRHPDLVAGLEAMANVDRTMHASDNNPDGQSAPKEIPETVALNVNVSAAAAPASAGPEDGNHVWRAYTPVGVKVRLEPVQETVTSSLGQGGKPAQGDKPTMIYTCNCAWYSTLHEFALCKHELECKRTNVTFRKLISQPGESQDGGASDAPVPDAPAPDATSLVGRYNPYEKDSYAKQRKVFAALEREKASQHAPVGESMKPLFLEAAENMERYIDSGRYKAGLEQHRVAMDSFYQAKGKASHKNPKPL